MFCHGITEACSAAAVIQCVVFSDTCSRNPRRSIASARDRPNLPAMFSARSLRAMLKREPVTRCPASRPRDRQLALPSTAVLKRDDFSLNRLGIPKIRAVLIQAGWNGSQHPMARSDSLDLHQRVVAEVDK